MIKHPKDRLERRSLEAKALENKLFRQRKINAKKRKIKTELQEKESEDELADYREISSRREPVGHPVTANGDW